MKISIIGAGDIEGHYFDILKLDKKRFEKEIENIGKTLAESGHEIVSLPDRGIPFEITKLYKKYGGRKAYGTVPKSDKDFGIGHMKKYMDAEINGKKVYDEFIDTKDWYKQDLTCCLYADSILILGLTTGSLGELAYAFYLYKIITGKKPGVDKDSNRIHPKISAGKNYPYRVLVYKPFIKEKLPYELEKYIKKFGGILEYIKNAKGLRKALK